MNPDGSTGHTWSGELPVSLEEKSDRMSAWTGRSDVANVAHYA